MNLRSMDWAKVAIKDTEPKVARVGDLRQGYVPARLIPMIRSTGEQSEEQTDDKNPFTHKTYSVTLGQMWYAELIKANTNSGAGMAKPFNQLREKMEPERRKRNKMRTESMLQGPLLADSTPTTNYLGATDAKPSPVSSQKAMIDKQLYRDAYEQYRHWNNIREQEQRQTAMQISPLESWRQYVALVELCWQLAGDSNQWERTQKLEALDRYYDRVKQLEAWRAKRAKAT